MYACWLRGPVRDSVETEAWSRLSHFKAAGADGAANLRLAPNKRRTTLALGTRARNMFTHKFCTRNLLALLRVAPPWSRLSDAGGRDYLGVGNSSIPRTFWRAADKCLFSIRATSRPTKSIICQMSRVYSSVVGCNLTIVQLSPSVSDVEYSHITAK